MIDQLKVIFNRICSFLIPFCFGTTNECTKICTQTKQCVESLNRYDLTIEPG